MEYILFIHNNADNRITDEAWKIFFTAARESGLFRGGSEIANRIQIGHKLVPDITKNIGGFMKFESPDLNAIKSLLKLHPVILSGGTLELCEMPRT